MKSVFISDAHIRSREDSSHKKLILFLESLRGNTNHLFILGDFFDFWFCSNGKINPEFQPAIDKLLELKTGGTLIYLFEGNHDFHMSEYFTGVHGIEVFPAWAEFMLEGRRILLSHGDLVDQNASYLLLRKVLRHPAFYLFQKFVPASLRWKLAAMSSDMSKEAGEHRELLISKMEHFAGQRLNEGFDAVILGHCHMPVFREYGEGPSRKVFCALGDWVEFYSYLVLENGSFRQLSIVSPNT